MRDPYKTLGVDKKSPPEEIKKAYRKRAKKTHGDAGGSDEEFREVKACYDLLADPVRRQRYDETGQTDEKPTFERQVASELQTLAVLTFANGNWKNHDLIGCMKKAIAENVQQSLLKKRKAADQIAELKDATVRITRKDDKENFLLVAFQAEQQAAEIALQSIEAQIKLLGAMIVAVDNFSWKVDKRPHATSFPTMTIGDPELARLFGVLHPES